MTASLTSDGGPLLLGDQERRWLSGADGNAMQLAMRLVAAAAEVSGATELVPIEMAHINSCHYSGRLSLDFAEFVLAERVTGSGTRGSEMSFAVPTHTNASLISCSSPGLRPEAADPETVAGARRLMEIYEQLGCSSMWTCAPYQQPEGRPSFGQQIVVSESNAVGFVNSVLGARTNKYGDLLDVAAAMVGRVPYSGLHTDEGRRATHVFDVSALPSATLADPNFPHLFGVVLGRHVGSRIGAIVGVPPSAHPSATEDGLKAIAAASAAAGGVGLFHVVGITPEAPTLDAATQGAAPSHHTTVTRQHLSDAARLLTNATGGETLGAVCLGTPHFSVAEFETLLKLLNGRRVADQVSLLVTTSRAVATELDLRSLSAELTDSGVEIVLDTCTYYPPHPTAIPVGAGGLALTNSAKWAYYAQGMLDVAVAFDSLERCVEAAIAGKWSG